MTDSQPNPPGSATTGIDLLIAGGRIFDPVTRRFQRGDIAVGGGKTLRIGGTIEAPPGARVCDATDLIVTPGLIDAHIHAFPLVTGIGLDVDPLSERSGVTTFIDAGSSGFLNFMALRRYVIEKARSKIYALLNISAIGQSTLGVDGFAYAEYDDLRFLHFVPAVDLIQKNRDLIVGIKVRMYTGLTSLAPLQAARALADEVGLPIVVHLAPPPPSFPDILPYLRPGDVITHVYHPPPGAMVDGAGKVRPEFQEARERGVLLDTGTARFHTNFPVMQAAFATGYYPDTISTDLTPGGLNTLVIDLPTCVNKCLAGGMPLEDALAAVTVAPARYLPAGCNAGRLIVGETADIAVFALEEGEYSYNDFFGNRIDTGKRLSHRLTIKDGVMLPIR
jgi:dihydroorotase